MSYSGKSIKNDLKDCYNLLDKKANCNGYSILNGSNEERLGVSSIGCAVRVNDAIVNLLKEQEYQLQEAVWIYRGKDAVQGGNDNNLRVVLRLNNFEQSKEIEIPEQMIFNDTSESIKKWIKDDLNTMFDDEDNLDYLCDKLRKAKTNKEMISAYQRIGYLMDGLLNA